MILSFEDIIDLKFGDVIDYHRVEVCYINLNTLSIELHTKALMKLNVTKVIIRKIIILTVKACYMVVCKGYSYPSNWSHTDVTFPLQLH